MMKIEGFENTDEPFYTVNRVEFDGIKIAEIYWHAVEYSGLDFVLIFFGYNKENQKSITGLIEEYHVKKANCIIGCIDIACEAIDYKDNEYEAFSSLMKQFDLHLDSASTVDFENLVEFCTSRETGCPTISMGDIKSVSGTEIYVVSEESSSINELKNLVSETCRRLFGHREQKFPRVMMAFLTNGYELELDEIEVLIDSLDGFITGDSYCWLVLNNKVPGLDNKTIKVSLIFCEEG